MSNATSEVESKKSLNLESFETQRKKWFNEICLDGHTLLSRAVLNGKISESVTLIKLGADVNVKVNRDETPLHIAAQKGHYILVEILISQGADINVKDKCGYSSLHYAILSADITTITYLIIKGADVNAETKVKGLTPLDIASELNNLPILKLLVNNGAKMNPKNIERNMGYAYQAYQTNSNNSKSSEVIDYLKSLTSTSTTTSTSNKDDILKFINNIEENLNKLKSQLQQK